MAAGGGGVGIFGQGSNGVGYGITGFQTGLEPYFEAVGGGGGSGGSKASNTTNTNSGPGGLYGGGGGGGDGGNGGNGANGAVRIIWPGDDRLFPSTRTTNE
jgi:hypothetical protein